MKTYQGINFPPLHQIEDIYIANKRSIVPFYLQCEDKHRKVSIVHMIWMRTNATDAIGKVQRMKSYKFYLSFCMLLEQKGNMSQKEGSSMCKHWVTFTLLPNDVSKRWNTYFRIAGKGSFRGADFTWLVDLSNLLMNMNAVLMPIVCFVFTRGFRDIFFVIRFAPNTNSYHQAGDAPLILKIPQQK